MHVVINPVKHGSMRIEAQLIHSHMLHVWRIILKNPVAPDEMVPDIQHELLKTGSLTLHCQRRRWHRPNKCTFWECFIDFMFRLQVLIYVSFVSVLSPNSAAALSFIERFRL